MPYRISCKIDNSNILNLNLYEARIENSLIENLSLIEALLFQCKCVLFLIDITRKDSFEKVKNLLNVIEFWKFHYLNGIIVFNKSDLIYRENIEIEKIKYLQKNKNVNFIEISIKNNINLKELLKRINDDLNKFILPINKISEKKYKNSLLTDIQENLNFILLGDSICGKTRFLERYFKHKYVDFLGATIGIDKEVKIIKFDNYNFKLTIWDTAGAERFRSQYNKFINISNAILLLLDLTNEESFNKINSWIEDIKIYSKGIIYLIGNKIDSCDRKISKEKAEKLANSFDIKYFEVSCKFDINISEVISNIILECLSTINKINNNDKKNIKKILHLNLDKIKINKYINY